MIEYLIEFDLLEQESFSIWCEFENLDDVIFWVEEELLARGGGHADIYDEEERFIGDVEV